jgi:hypothetical protein
VFAMLFAMHTPGGSLRPLAPRESRFNVPS